MITKQNTMKSWFEFNKFLIGIIVGFILYNITLMIAMILAFAIQHIK